MKSLDASRRRLLRLAAVGLAGGIAGCGSDGGGTPTNGTPSGTTDGSGHGTADKPSVDLTVEPEKQWDAEIDGELETVEVGPEFAIATTSVQTTGSQYRGRAVVVDRETGQRVDDFDLPEYPWSVVTGWDEGFVAIKCHSLTFSEGQTEYVRIDLDEMTGDVVARFDPMIHTVSDRFDGTSLLLGSTFAQQDRTPTLFEYDIETGSRGWEFPVAGPEPEMNFPAADDERIYTANRGQFYAVSRADGSEQWSVSLDRGLNTLNLVDSELLFTDRYFRMQGNPDSWTVYSYDTRGNERWTTDLDLVPYERVRVAGDYRTIMARRTPEEDSQSVFAVLDGDGGDVLWTAPLDLPQGARPYSDPIGEYAHVYSDRSYDVYDLASGDRVETFSEYPTGYRPFEEGGAVVYATDDAVRALDPDSLSELWRIELDSSAGMSWADAGLVVDTGSEIAFYAAQRV